MTPNWLTAVAWTYIGLCFICTSIISYVIASNHRRQPMGVMNLVFPITTMYSGPFALAFYWRWGRAAERMPATGDITVADTPHHLAVTSSGAGVRERCRQHPQGDLVAGSRSEDELRGLRQSAKPRWATTATEVSHCGSGCSVGDLISEFVIVALARTYGRRQRPFCRVHRRLHTRCSPRNPLPILRYRTDAGPWHPGWA